MKRNSLIIIAVLVLAFFAGNLVSPVYFDKVVNFFNQKTGANFPHFWQKPFKLGLDLQGGTHLVYEADLSTVDKKDYSLAMQGLRDIIERRVDLFGVQEPLVQVQDSGTSHRLIVELAGIKDPAEAIKMIGQTPFLEFKEERPQEETQKILDKRKELEGKTQEEIQKIDNWQLGLQDPYFQSTTLTGKYLKKSELGFDQNTQKPLILLQFNDEGSKIFEDLTAKSVGKRIAIYIDSNLLSAPVVNEKISGGNAQISGDFTVTSARDLVKNLNAGALPVPIKMISEQSVGPALGAISLKQSLNAGIYGFLGVIIFLLVFYRLPGFFASASLLIYIAVMLSVSKLIPITLTLAGIAGFLLSVGMAVDANILIFSRLREELKEGKDYLFALQEAGRRAWPSIRDGNLTTILVGLILFAFGTSFVKGFALTLVIGNLLSMFTAIFITNNLLRIFYNKRIPTWFWR